MFQSSPYFISKCEIIENLNTTLQKLPSWCLTVSDRVRLDIPFLSSDAQSSDQVYGLLKFYKSDYGKL